jgi:hypothetical protein
MTRKASNKLTTEELLSIIDGKTTGKENLLNQGLELYKNDVLEFLKVFNIKEGKDRVKDIVLYKFYRTWSRNGISRRSFVIEITHIFQAIRYRYGSYFLLNKSAISIKKESWNYNRPNLKTRSKAWKAHFDKFILYYNIKKGRLYIKDSILYNLYDKWTYSTHKRHPLGEFQFNSFCKLYFKHRITNQTNYYELDESIINHFSEEMIKEIRARKYGQRKKVKKITS